MCINTTWSAEYVTHNKYNFQVRVLNMTLVLFLSKNDPITLITKTVKMTYSYIPVRIPPVMCNLPILTNCLDLGWGRGRGGGVTDHHLALSDLF